MTISFNGAIGVNEKLSVGMGFGMLQSFPNISLAAGKHFASEGTLIKLQGRDQYGNEKFFEFAQLNFFARLHHKNKIGFLDIGFKYAPFIHIDDSDDDFGGGVFKGIYIKSFLFSKKPRINGIPPKSKVAVGLQLSAGKFKESEKTNEFGVQGNFWIRLYFNKY